MAVVAVKSPITFKLALFPNMIPDGFIKKRLLLPPVTCIKPSIKETSPPTILPKILLILGFVKKFATSPWVKPNFSKLWNKFTPSPDKVPPVIS